MKKIVCLAALLLAVAFALTACGAGGGKPWTHTYAWIYIDGETIAEGYVSENHEYRDGSVYVTIDGKRYRTSYENVVMVDLPEPVQPEETEVRPC